MFSRILVPLDCSPQSTAILPYVERLATPGLTEIILLQVAEETEDMFLPQPQLLPDRFAPRGTQPREEFTDRYLRIEEALSAAANQARSSLLAAAARLSSRGLVVRTVVRFGSPSQEIIACAKQERVDLVTLSAHGWSGFSQFLFGNVADQVVRNLPLPVLLIRTTETEEAF